VLEADQVGLADDVAELAAGAGVGDEPELVGPTPLAGEDGDGRLAVVLDDRTGGSSDPHSLGTLSIESGNV
jgi:hypothetical protein